ncbi:MAG: cytochrome c biogenesis protein CcsA [Chloroflexi bacterium]|nr:cytochrome c biogenesis protein CcsA [Chloroflexota bacterium]
MRINNLTLGLIAAGMVAALYLAFLYAPTEAMMGDVQRIFYFHVPMAWVAFLAFGVVFAGSVLYLWKGEERWDRLAYAAAHLGVIFTSLNVVTGILWAKPIWGTWWVWDPRLTTTTVLWIIYIAYLVVHNAAETGRGSHFAAVFGIVGFVDVPVVYMSIRWWRTMHPAPVIAGGSDSGLAPSMLFTLLFSVGLFTLFFVYLLRQSLSLSHLEAEVERLSQEERGG